MKGLSVVTGSELGFGDRGEMAFDQTEDPAQISRSKKMKFYQTKRKGRNI